jgi:hypothetical protein
MLPNGRIVMAFVVLAVAAAGCSPTAPSGPIAVPGGSPSPVASEATEAAARIRGWSDDIDLLVETREKVHPDPWRGIARADWIAAADAVKAQLPEIDDNEALADLVRLAAMPSWNGRDGHTGIFPFIPDSGTHEYPVRWWRFPEGLVITAARAPYEDLVGSRVVAINGHSTADVLALVEPLAPRDNPSNLLAYGPLYLRVSELLAGLGVIDAEGPATLSLVGRDGVARDVAITPRSAADDVAWNSGQPHRLPPTADALWLQQQSTTLWWTYLADSRTLYVQYNAVEGGIDEIASEILARAKRPDVDRVVVDIRNNGGGDNRTMTRFEEDLRDPAIDRPGRFFILFGRTTFSAGANFATDLDATSNAIFVGEPLGGSPNLYADVRPTRLPYSGQAYYVATHYIRRTTDDDPRITIEPDIAMPMTAADYFAGRDPVLQAAIMAPTSTR